MQGGHHIRSTYFARPHCLATGFNSSASLVTRRLAYFPGRQRETPTFKFGRRSPGRARRRRADLRKRMTSSNRLGLRREPPASLWRRQKRRRILLAPRGPGLRAYQKLKSCFTHCKLHWPASHFFRFESGSVARVRIKYCECVTCHVSRFQNLHTSQQRSIGNAQDLTSRSETQI